MRKFQKRIPAVVVPRRIQIEPVRRRVMAAGRARMHDKSNSEGTIMIRIDPVATHSTPSLVNLYLNNFPDPAGGGSARGVGPVASPMASMVAMAAVIANSNVPPRNERRDPAAFDPEHPLLGPHPTD